VAAKAARLRAAPRLVPPDAEVRTLRTLVRYRAELIERRAPHINHMTQALKHMNIQLNLVLSDITGATGL
jgi:transposase